MIGPKLDRDIIDEAYASLVMKIFENFHLDHDVERFKAAMARAKQSKALAYSHLS